jgi:hypothetical protein
MSGRPFQLLPGVKFLSYLSMDGWPYATCLVVGPELPLYRGWHTRPTCIAAASELPVCCSIGYSGPLPVDGPRSYWTAVP